MTGAEFSYPAEVVYERAAETRALRERADKAEAMITTMAEQMAAADAHWRDLFGEASMADVRGELTELRAFRAEITRESRRRADEFRQHARGWGDR